MKRFFFFLLFCFFQFNIYISVVNAQTSDLSVCTWKDCKTAAVSYSEDDGLTLCQPQLDALGLKGTFYFGGTTAQSWLSTFSASGHEIGSHLTNHDLNCMTPPSCFPNCTFQTLYQTPYTQADILNFRQNQIEPNLAAIEAATGKPVLSMAYPCGNTDASRMIASSFYFVGSRGYFDPWDSNLTWIYDVNLTTPPEFMNLNSDTMFTQSLLDKALATGGWEIATMHDYCSGIDVINAQKNVVWIGTVGEVLKYIKVRDAAVFSNYIRLGSSISFDVVHNLNDFSRQKVDGTMMTPVLFDNPVTIKIGILNSDTVVGVQANGASLNFDIATFSGSKFVLINTPIRTPQHIVVGLNACEVPADVDCSGQVNVLDLAKLILKFGASVNGDREDIDGSGKVNSLDLSILLSNFGS